MALWSAMRSRSQRALPAGAPTKFETHMFWAYGGLSNVERLCLNSFVENGFAVSLWTYGQIGNAPEGVRVRDAREVLPEDRVFLYENGSYAGFADLFRYTVLSRFGGLYADTDIVCLTTPDQLGSEPFLVAAHSKTREPKISNALIFDPAPTRGDFVDVARAFSDVFPKDGQKWGDCGPRLFSMLAANYPHLAFRVMAPEFCNSIDFSQCPRKLLTPGTRVASGAYFLHLYNEMWRRAEIDKNAPFPKGSLMAEFAERYMPPL